MRPKKFRTLDEFMPALFESWTWKKLTEEERARFCTNIVFVPQSGSHEERMEQLACVYSMFLVGCGYDGINWRAEK